ncbi:acyltransferase family protein (plasmid) [Cetobacterium somerae ATCC BAA-474]
MSILKGIGICLVVIGHTNSFLVKYVYLFHVPLFYFINGYFLKSTFHTFIERKIYFKRKVLKLYIPFITIVLTMVFLHNIFYKIYWVRDYYSINELIKNILKALFFLNSEILLGAIWFIPSLFLSFCLYMFLNTIFHKKAIVISSFLLVYALVFSSGDAYINKVLEITFIGQFFMQLGNIYKKNEYRIKFNLLLGVIAIFLFIILGNNINIIDIANRKYSEIYLFLPVTLCGIYLSLYATNLLDNVKCINNILSFIGIKSYVIMCFHIVSFKFLSFCYIVSNKLNIERLIEFPILKETNIAYLYILFGIFLPILVDIILVFFKSKLTKVNSNKIIGFINLLNIKILQRNKNEKNNFYSK